MQPLTRTSKALGKHIFRPKQAPLQRETAQSFGAIALLKYIRKFKGWFHFDANTLILVK